MPSKQSRNDARPHEVKKRAPQEVLRSAQDAEKEQSVEVKLHLDKPVNKISERKDQERNWHIKIDNRQPVEYTLRIPACARNPEHEQNCQHMTYGQSIPALVSHSFSHQYCKASSNA
jgi:hypothetical protein